MPTQPLPPAGDAVGETLRGALERFLAATPEAGVAEHAPAVTTLRTLAHFVDTHPSAPLLAQWQVALGRLQRALAKDDDKPEQIDELLGDE